MNEFRARIFSNLQSPAAIFGAFAGVCLLMVGFFAIFGSPIMSLLARHDPDPIQRHRAMTLETIHNIIRYGLEIEIPESDLLARDHGQGPGRINCVVMGAKAEKAGRSAEAYLWFALDARARSMNDAVTAYEIEALRLAFSTATDRAAGLDDILNTYSELSSQLDAEAKATGKP